MKAKEILQKARNQIIQVIIENIERLWKKDNDGSRPDFEAGEQYDIDLSDSGILTEICVDNLCCTDEPQLESRYLERIQMDDRYRITIFTEAPDETPAPQIKTTDLSAETLAEIATHLENAA